MPSKTYKERKSSSKRSGSSGAKTDSSKKPSPPQFKIELPDRDYEDVSDRARKIIEKGWKALSQRKWRWEFIRRSDLFLKDRWFYLDPNKDDHLFKDCYHDTLNLYQYECQI